MLTIFIDLASSAKFFALVSNEKTLSILAIDDQKQEEILMETIESMLRGQHKNLSDLTHIACVLGPGGFTSLRIAIAMANALSFTLDIPSTGIHLSDVCAARMHQKDFLWVHTTRKSHLFVRGFGVHTKISPEESLMKLDDVTALIPKNAPLVGELIPEHCKVLHLTTPDRSIEETLPLFLPDLIYQKGQILMPWYGREA